MPGELSFIVILKWAVVMKFYDKDDGSEENVPGILIF
jgi:hypothetical protein